MKTKNPQTKEMRQYAEKRKAIRMRANLIELLMDMPSGHRTYEETERYAEDVADYLIDNGVTVTIKKEKPPTDLSGKCGSCEYAKAECPSVYVRCTKHEHIAKYFTKRDGSLRQRTTPACKQYKPKEGA